ncbi:MAG: AraC family transcriptional regulator [Lachnospiraceae bacterium]|nr:AraC family transcriptional regulator [Lachnospiraceae bacterium]
MLESNKRKYKEKMPHGTLELPVSIHKMTYPDNMEIFFYPHWHKEFELFLVLSGNILFSIEDREYFMKEGDICFVNNELLHQAKAVESKGASFFAVDFSYDMLEHDIKSSFYSKYVGSIIDGRVRFNEFIEFDNLEWKRKLQDYILELYECPEHDLKKHELLLKSHLLEVWTLLFLNNSTKSNFSRLDYIGYDRIKPVIKYIEDNYSYDIKVSDLSNILSLSDSQFCRTFKNVTGFSPVQYINRHRILISCNKLSETDLSISEIANTCGFSNISYFNRVFLKTIGCTPKEYRKGSL